MKKFNQFLKINEEDQVVKPPVATQTTTEAPVATQSTTMKPVAQTTKEAPKFTNQKLAIDLANAVKQGPTVLRTFLDSEEGKSEALRSLLKEPKLDGVNDDDPIKVTDAPNTPVNTLVPTQNFIDLMQSVAFPLSKFDGLVNAINKKKGFGTIIISPKGKNDKLPEGAYLIIDGHHRWSGIYAIAPDGVIDAKIVDWPGVDTKQKLAAAQLAIAAKIGTGKELPSASGTPKFNILGKDAKFISELIMQNINKQADPKAGLLLNDDMINEIIKQKNGTSKIVFTWTGLDINETDLTKIRQAIANKIGANLATLKVNPQAPPREDMPQFASKVGGPEFDEVQQDLKSGEFNVAYPYVKQANAAVAKPTAKPAQAAVESNIISFKKFKKFINEKKK